MNWRPLLTSAHKHQIEHFPNSFKNSPKKKTIFVSPSPFPPMFKKIFFIPFLSFSIVIIAFHAVFYFFMCLFIRSNSLTCIRNFTHFLLLFFLCSNSSSEASAFTSNYQHKISNKLIKLVMLVFAFLSCSLFFLLLCFCF